MPEQSQVAKALRDWFLGCEVLRNSRLLGVDYLAQNPNNFAVILESSQLMTSTDILGNVYLNDIQVQSFALSNTNAYGAEALQNLKNLGILDQVVEWMIEQNNAHQLPNYPGATGAISCLPTTAPMLYMAEGDRGFYQINGQLKYRRQKES